MTGPTLRLAHSPGAQGDNCLMGRNGVERIPQHPTVRLATGSSPGYCLTGAYGVEKVPNDEHAGEYGYDPRPALLISFAYLDGFLKNQDRYTYRDWAMDSGAFTAHSSGKPVELNRYIDTCLQLKEKDPTLTEIFALDVIGDWEASIRNAEEMHRQGVAAIPTYHCGSPEDALLHLAEHYEKISLGGAVGMRFKQKLEWARACFARVWPKKIHGLGFGSRRHILALPWHSVDATNWEVAPCKFGNWATYGPLQIRGSQQNLRVEVDHYLKIERQARRKWATVLSELDDPNTSRVRLAVANNQDGRLRDALGKRED